MTDTTPLLRLGDAAIRAGVSPAMLHYYLLLRVVEPTSVSPGQQRLFDRRAVKRIQLVRELNDAGYPLREIRDIFIAPPTRT